MARTKTNTTPDTATTKNVVAENSVVDKNNKVVSLPDLEDLDEIEVVSLIPNVSYKDSKSGDYYEWDEVGHVEFLTFDTLKNMWRNNKGYFRNLWLKPNDERVIDKFKLNNMYEKYEFLMNESSYKKNNIDKIIDAIDTASNELRFAVCNKIKDMVVSEELTDITIIKALEKKLRTDFVSFI